MTIFITHTHADGTVLTGSRKGDGVYEIVSQHGFRYGHSVGIYIRGSRDRDAPAIRINAAAEALRAAGHEVVVDLDNTWRPTAEVEADRADRAADRAERLEDRADRAAGRAQTHQAAGDAVFNQIPFGQPMMPDHYSYRADRNRRDRARGQLDKAHQERQYAGHLADRADGVAANQEQRENPRTTLRRIEKLEKEVRDWTRRQAGASGDEYRDRAVREIDRLQEQITYWRGHLDQIGFLPWGREHFQAGDQVNIGGTWHRVVRVNTKTLSVPWRVGAMSGVESTHTDTIPYDEIYGRRRDGQQIDTPGGEPWPVVLAARVARWTGLARGAGLPSTRYDTETRYVRWAQRIVHGLSLDAGEREITTREDSVTTTTQRRDLAAAYLAVFDRLTVGQLVPDIITGLTPWVSSPAWRFPAGQEPQDRRVYPGWPHVNGQQFIGVGDLLAGVWVWGRGGATRTLYRDFIGPVTAVSEPVDRHEAGTWCTVTLTDGTTRELETGQWVAVHPAGTWETPGDPA